MPAKKITPTREENSEMPKENDSPASFEQALDALEQIVARLESGDLPLEEALIAFESGIQLARQGQQKLHQAEQRVQILLSEDPDAELSPFTPPSAHNNKPL